jgi:hypothetical protein
MKQAFSLRFPLRLQPRALPWASMWEALGLHQKSKIKNQKSSIINRISSSSTINSTRNRFTASSTENANAALLRRRSR